MRKTGRVRARWQLAKSSVLVASAALVTLMVASALALAADVRGQAVLGAYHPPAAQKPARPAFNWEIENGVKEVARERVPTRELSIVLVGAGDTRAPDNFEVPISGGNLFPSTVVVRTGTTLRIRNDDEIGHELYGDGLEGFSSESTSPHAMRSIHLTKAGDWALHDKLAPHAHAHLHVLADLIAVAKIENNGSYSFSDIPAGKYTVKVFHGANVVATKAIEVGDRTLTVDPLTLTAATAPNKAAP